MWSSRTRKRGARGLAGAAPALAPARPLGQPERRDDEARAAPARCAITCAPHGSVRLKKRASARVSQLAAARVPLETVARQREVARGAARRRRAAACPPTRARPARPPGRPRAFGRRSARARRRRRTSERCSAVDPASAARCGRRRPPQAPRRARRRRSRATRWSACEASSHQDYARAGRADVRLAHGRRDAAYPVAMADRSTGTSSPPRWASSPASPAPRSASGRAGATSARRSRTASRASTASRTSPRPRSSASCSAAASRTPTSGARSSGCGEEYGDWPLSEAPLGTATQRGRMRVVLRERDGCYALCPRGWQLMAAPPPVIEEVRLRLNRRRRWSAPEAARGAARPASCRSPRRRVADGVRRRGARRGRAGPARRARPPPPARSRARSPPARASSSSSRSRASQRRWKPASCSSPRVAASRPR